eukprot:1787065-Pleurochrysis_carterae.AAC.1
MSVLTHTPQSMLAHSLNKFLMSKMLAVHPDGSHENYDMSRVMPVLPSHRLSRCRGNSETSDALPGIAISAPVQGAPTEMLPHT